MAWLDEFHARCRAELSAELLRRRRRGVRADARVAPPRDRADEAVERGGEAAGVLSLFYYPSCREIPRVESLRLIERVARDGFSVKFQAAIAAVRGDCESCKLLLKLVALGPRSKMRDATAFAPFYSAVGFGTSPRSPRSVHARPRRSCCRKPRQST